MIDVTIAPPVFALQKGFAGVALDIRSFREPLKRSVQAVVAPFIRHQFDVGGIPSWEPLVDATVENKGRLGYNDPGAPLIATGKLKRVAGQLNVWKIDSNSAVAAGLPGAEYGEFHMSGTSRMPARPFMEITEDQIDEIEQVFSIWLGQRFAAHGFR